MKTHALKPPDFMTKDMRRTILKIRILVRIKSSSTYPYALIKEFENGHAAAFFGSTIKNDIYNILGSLEKSGYIKAVVRSSDNGKKYYVITKKGSSTVASIGKAFKFMMGYANNLLK